MSLSPPTNSGFFVTFEGIDGCGKTTQWQHCYTALSRQFPNRLVVQTRNPGGTALGKHLRQLLLTPTGANEAPINPTAELLLYMADRAQHVAEVVKPALAQGAIVLCDRFIDSSVAYQGAARGLSPLVIDQLNAIACQGVAPHLTLLFDGDPAVLAQRVAQRGALDRLELEGLAFQHKVREGFLALAKQHPQRIVTLNATLPLATVTEAVMATVTPLLTSL